MLGSEVTTRSPPPRRFENYTLTRVIDSSSGLTSVPDTSFTQVSGSVGTGLSDDVVSDPISIGFEFNLDGVIYKQWAACTNGWLALVDPESGSFVSTEVLTSSSWINESIRPAFTSQAVLLAPWFDDLKNVANQASQLSASPFSYSATKISRINSGLETPPIFYNPTSYGVSYYNDIRSEKGRRLIVRWSSISNFTRPTSVIKFEVVIYENGTIEYRYAARTSIFPNPRGASFEGATIGVFMPNGTNRFRDFSVGLGYREGSRQEHIYGGFDYNAAYIDTARSGSENFPLSASYTVNLVPFINWPGLTTTGAIFAFSPPKRRRKVLPRRTVQNRDMRISLPLTARTGDDRLGTTLGAFDDRRSPNYTLSNGQSLVNYPSTLSRFFGGTGAGVLERQDIFAGDFLVTGNVVKNAIEPFVNDEPMRSSEAFNESSRHDQDQSTLSSLFFASGTTGPNVVNGFDQPLKSKTQIRFSLPVAYSTQLPSSTSSIYYYNARTKSWETPVNSTYTIGSGSSLPPSGALGFVGGDWATPQVDANASRIIEDARGFGPVGNIVSSGSHVPTGTEQTDFVIGSTYNPTSLSLVVGKSYPKSIRNNEEYRPTFDETFTLPINAPFLIEKAVFEIPLAAGPGWFADQTQCFVPLNGNAFDFAGPALTFALHRNIQLSENSPGPSRRDLILTGTVTHQLDNVSQISMDNFPPYDTVYQVRPVGFLAYANPPGGVVDPNLSNQFTGTVTVNAQALSCAGIYVRFNKNFGDGGSAAQNATNLVNFLLNTPKLVLGTNASSPAQTASVGYVSPLGRGGSGFQQSGRCILGNEFTTLQGLTDQSGATFPNPFLESALTPQQSGTLTPPPVGFQARAETIVPLVTHFPAPYLVMPGDRLVLSVSKMRPFMYSSGGGVPTFSGSLQHDVQLTPGNVNVTLYGSQVQAGAEYHDTLNQPLASNALHELVGAEPVLDQFEVAYRDEYTGSYSDNMILGPLGTQLFVSQSGGITQAYLALQTNRDRKLSKLGATRSTTSVSDPRPDPANFDGSASGLSPKPLKNITVISSIPAALTTASADTAINPYKSYRLQDWVEKAGGVRPVQFTDSSERFWDSMMPSIADCFSADGSGIFITPAGTFGDGRQVDVAITGSSGLFDPNKRLNGWILFDNQNPSFGSVIGPIINGNWNKSYPFEPRYLGVSRQLDIGKSFLAKYIYQPFSTPVVAAIPPTPVSGFFFGTAAAGLGVYNISSITKTFFGGSYILYGMTQTNEWLADVNLSGKVAIPSGTGGGQFTYPSQMPSTVYATSSLNVNDASRALFGFGDRNTCFISNNSVLGTNHFPDTRDVEGPHPDSFLSYSDSNNFRYSPVIRGWKYGVYSGLPAFNKAYWRHGRYGQFRDMLEQRLFSKFYQIPDANNSADIQPGVQPAAVTVTFLDPSSRRLTAPDNTWSSNLHFECTSSIPFFDGTHTNRPTVNPAILNLHPNLVRHDRRGNIHIA